MLTILNFQCDLFVKKLIVMKLFRFALLFFDGTVLTEKFCVSVPLSIKSIYLSINVTCI